VGTKIDTIEKEPKQRADTTTDLSKQKPQEEVLKLKSSTASSEEEKLAAGISTIKLRTRGSAEEKARKRTKDEGGNLD
jgi:hypothetical protein